MGCSEHKLSFQLWILLRLLLQRLLLGAWDNQCITGIPLGTTDLSPCRMHFVPITRSGDPNIGLFPFQASKLSLHHISSSFAWGERWIYDWEPKWFKALFLSPCKWWKGTRKTLWMVMILPVSEVDLKQFDLLYIPFWLCPLAKPESLPGSQWECIKLKFVWLGSEWSLVNWS